MLKTFFILTFLATFLAQSQTVYHQDIFNGGVCVVGTSTHDASGSVDFPYYIEPFSEIRKIFLITYTEIPEIGEVVDSDVFIDGIPFNQNELNKTNVIVDNLYLPDGTGAIGYESHITDITPYYSPSGATINITSTPTFAPEYCPSCRYAAPIIVILYENNNLDKVNFALVLNDGEESNENYVQLTDLNPVDITGDIGFGVHMDRLSGFSNDGYHFNINSNYIGYLNGPDSPSIGTNGVIGCFYYQNNQLLGLTDDISDNVMQGSDGIMRLNNFYIGSLNGTVIKTVYGEGSPNHMHNIFVGMNFAYTTPCDTFAVTVSNDSTICPYEPLQLFASGGVSYKWEPAFNLSCTTCPNPVFFGDSSMHYRVQIWNNDSCSIIRPVNVHVRPTPQFESASVQESVCGTNNGSVTFNYAIGTTTPVTYAIQGGPFQTSNVFSSLATGNYNFIIQDGNGCLSEDTLVLVPDENNTFAAFTVSPDYGVAPLSIELTNASLNATDYLWTVNGINEGSTLSSFTCDTLGTYTFELIAWQYDLNCSDTAYQTIIVIDKLIIPTAFTPDNDGVNDLWVLPNIDEIYPENIVSIYNRWGELLFKSISGKYLTQPWEGKFIDKNLPIDSYYYIIETNDTIGETFNGIVSIIR